MACSMSIAEKLDIRHQTSDIGGVQFRISYLLSRQDIHQHNNKSKQETNQHATSDSDCEQQLRNTKRAT